MTASSGAEPAHVTGGDALLADAARRNAGGRVRFCADASSDLARAIGVSTQLGRVTTTTSLDVLHVDTGAWAVNMVVLGVAPDRARWWHRGKRVRVEVDGRIVHDGNATTVLIANGEYLRGLDVVPRGHPADGRLEVHVYAVPPAQRQRMRARLAAGTHVPHPGITTAQGRRATVRWDRPEDVEVDGVPASRRAEVEVHLSPGELTLVP